MSKGTTMLNYKMTFTRLLTSLFLCWLTLLPTIAQAAPAQGLNIQPRWQPVVNQEEGFQLETPTAWTSLTLTEDALSLGSAFIGENNPQLQALFDSPAFQQFFSSSMKFFALDLSPEGLAHLLPPSINVIKLDIGADLPLTTLKQLNERQLSLLAEPGYPLQSEIVTTHGHEAIIFQYIMSYSFGGDATQLTQLTQLLLTDQGVQYILTVGIPLTAVDTYRPTVKHILNSFQLTTATTTLDSTPTSTPIVATPTATATPPPPQPLATVQVANLNVRSGPGTNYARIGTVTRGQQLMVVGQVQNCRWLQVQVEGNKLAWVAGPPQYTQLDQSCTAIPVITTIPTPPPPPPAAAQPCVRFDNHFGKEAHVTLRIPGNHEWNQEFTIPPHGKETRCLSAGRYTASVNVPSIGQVNGEFTLDRGTLVIPIQ
jgi:uncharacterized protein YraI